MTTLRNVIASSLFLIFLQIAVNGAKPKYCGEALVKDLPDISVSSSTVHEYYESYYGKLDGKHQEGWIPKGSDPHPYLEFDLGRLYLICGFEVQGCRIRIDKEMQSSFVKRYRAQVSPEKEYWDSWNFIKPELYGGNTGEEKVYSIAQERKVGRYVRIFPVDQKTFSKAEMKLCMKAEVYGIPYLSKGWNVFYLESKDFMQYQKTWKVDQVGAVEVTVSSQHMGKKHVRISDYVQIIPHHVPLKTELRVDACVLAPRISNQQYFVSARVEKANPDTDEYFVKNLADNVDIKARKVKREQLQVVFSAWCKAIDHFERISKQMCLGKIVQVDSMLVFKPAKIDRKPLLRISYKDREAKDFVSNRRVDEVKHGQIQVMYYKNYKTKCDIATGTAKYNKDAFSYFVNGNTNIRRKSHELWYKVEGPDSCKSKNVGKFKCWNSRIPFIVNRLNCSTLKLWNGDKCEDEDECKTGMAACGLHASCENTKAGYKCYCPRLGFLEGDAHKEACQDIDECKEGNKCDEQAICKNTPGSYTCHCKKGFKGVGRVCKDINECEVSVNRKHCEKHKNAVCKNFPGGYQCECKPGFHGKVTQCKDLDECTSKKHKCSPYAQCTNAIGSYNCECKDGFHGDGRNCEDNKECKEPSKSRSCHAFGHCVDTLGGYKCECNEGYHGDGIKTCVIANECKLGIHKCHKTWATCVDTRKSYDCHCNKGFEGDGRSCQDIDECARKKHKCGSTIGIECLNTNGSYKCVCVKGFAGNGKNCVDIDECKTGVHNCVKNAICVNRDGDFNCGCKTGFWGDPTKRCEPKTKCMEKLPHCDLPRAVCKTTEKSHSTPEKYDCFCKSGFTGSNSNCIDIDECLNNDTCSKDATCTNTDGGFLCRCKNGFTGSGLICSDVNECSDKTICPPNVDCINTKGSFKCRCKAGFSGENPYKQCSDVDECTQHRICEYGQKCTNTFGSYNCSCDKGFYLIDAERNKCEDIDECKNAKQNCGTYHTTRCENTAGNYFCRCDPGFRFNREAKGCTDIDECNSGKWPCAEEATCNNNEGGYSCACPKGYLGDGKYFCEVDNSSPSHEATKGLTLLVAMVTLLLISAAFRV